MLAKRDATVTLSVRTALTVSQAEYGHFKLLEERDWRPSRVNQLVASKTDRSEMSDQVSSRGTRLLRIGASSRRKNQYPNRRSDRSPETIVGINDSPICVANTLGFDTIQPVNSFAGQTIRRAPSSSVNDAVFYRSIIA